MIEMSFLQGGEHLRSLPSYGHTVSGSQSLGEQGLQALLKRAQEQGWKIRSQAGLERLLLRCAKGQGSA